MSLLVNCRPYLYFIGGLNFFSIINSVFFTFLTDDECESFSHIEKECRVKTHFDLIYDKDHASIYL